MAEIRKTLTNREEAMDSCCRERLRVIFSTDKIYRVERVQSLWSGYGEIARYLVNEKPVICKVVYPDNQVNHPRGWKNQTSHQRKLDSYRNEQLFYATYADLSSGNCRIPNCIDFGGHEDLRWLILEDLNASGFPERVSMPSLPIIYKGVEWLAHFHRTYLTIKTETLWPIGTYWHLSTRRDEFEAMEPSPLKEHAHSIDNLLNKATFQTLVHGDAKIANFCLSTDHNALAAVDFQYVGRGAGIKDLIYFLGSCLSSNALSQYYESLVAHYFSVFDHANIEAEWRALLPFAWADFERFLVGWAPEHVKRHHFSAMQTNRALASLK